MYHSISPPEACDYFVKTQPAVVRLDTQPPFMAFRSL